MPSEASHIGCAGIPQDPFSARSRRVFTHVGVKGNGCGMPTPSGTEPERLRGTPGVGRIRCRTSREGDEGRSGPALVGTDAIDLFFRASTFHEGVAIRTVHHLFAGSELPFLSAVDLAVFKALFGRPKDWIDIEAMIDAGAVEVREVIDTLRSLVGDDQRVDRLRALAH